MTWDVGHDDYKEVQTAKQLLSINDQIRASDAERAHYSNLVRRAHKEGRIDSATMNRRLEHISTSVHKSTLAWTISDLPKSQAKFDDKIDRIDNYREEHINRFHGGITTILLLSIFGGWLTSSLINDNSGAGGVVMVLWSIVAGMAMLINIGLWIADA